MKILTSSTDCLIESSNENIYLSWNEMKWNYIGNVFDYDVSVKDICKPIHDINTIFLPGNTFSEHLTSFVFFHFRLFYSDG